MNGGLCSLYKGLGHAISLRKRLEDFCEDNTEKNAFMCCVGKICIHDLNVLASFFRMYQIPT